MDSLPYDDIDQLASCLYMTFKGKPDEVKQAGAYINEMAKDIVRFATSLMNVATCDRSEPEFQQTKASACIVLSTSLKALIDKEVMTPEIKNQLLEIIIKSMFSNKLTHHLKMNLRSSFEELYKADSGIDLRKKSLYFIQQKLTEGSLDDYASSFLIFQQVVKSQRFSKDSLADCWKMIREALIFASNNIIQGIVSELKAAIAENSNQKVENVFYGIKVLRNFVLAIKSCIDKMGKRRKDEGKVKLYSANMQTIISYEPLVQVLSTILTLQVPSEKQLPLCLFSTSGVVGIDEILNGTKADTLTCFNKVIDFANKFTFLLNTNTNKFLAFAMESGIKGVLQSLLTFCENENLDYESIPKNEELNDCIVQSLRFLALLASQSELNEFYTSFYKRLIINVCLPLIRSTQDELDKFELEPFEFVSLASDTVADQLSAVAKTQAVHLLDHLCDFVDGALTFLGMHLYTVMEYSLVCNNIEEIPTRYPSLMEYSNSLLLSRTSPKIRLETSIIALTSVSYHVSKRSDLAESLENFMARYRDVFYSNEADPLIKVRMCLFVGYYFEVLFLSPNAKEFFGMQLKFLIDCLAEREEGRRAISEQAIDSLSTVFKQNELRNKIGPFLPEVIEKLAYFIEFADNSAYFDIIEKLFTIFRKRLTQNPAFIGVLVSQMVKRILIELEDMRAIHSKNAESQILNRIFGIIAIISEDEGLIPQFQQDIEKLLEPLLPYLDDNAPFDDDLIIYVTTTTKIAKRVSDFCWMVVKYFPKMFELSKGLFGSLYSSLNQVIIHGKSVLDQDPDSVRVFINMGIQGLNPTHKKATDSDACEAALILQLLIQYSQAITNEDWQRIIVACLQKLNSTKKGYVKSKVAGVVLTGFIYNFELTYKIVAHEGILQNFLTLCLDSAADFDHPYDQKLFLLGLCNMLIQGIKDEAIHDKVFQIFNVLISFLRFTEAMDQQAVRIRTDDKKPLTRREHLLKYLSTRDDSEFAKASQKQFAEDPVEKQVSFPDGAGYEESKGGEDDQDYEDADDYGNVSDPDEKEAIKMTNKFESDLIYRDEFQIFKQAIFAVRDVDANILKDLVEWLPDNKKNYLREVLDTQRVVVVDTKDGVQETEARRIAKVRARKIANVNVGNMGNTNH